MKNVDLSKEPREWIRAKLTRYLGKVPSDFELDAYIGGGTLTDRKCHNPLCDWKLQRAQSRFCTRCWQAITMVRELTK